MVRSKQKVEIDELQSAIKNSPGKASVHTTSPKLTRTPYSQQMFEIDDKFDPCHKGSISLSPAHHEATLTGQADNVYISRVTEGSRKDTYRIRIRSSAAKDIHFGLEYTDKSGHLYEWRYQLRFGEKYEPDSGWTPYTEKRISEGDVIKMVVENTNLAFWLNEAYLGVAFSDACINKDGSRPFVWLGTQHDLVELLPGGRS